MSTRPSIPHYSSSPYSPEAGLGGASPSLWGSPSHNSPGNDYDDDDLTLPPINPDADNNNNYNYGLLPPFLNNPQFFGGSLSPFGALLASTSVGRAQDDHNQDQLPPLSNQQSQRQQPLVSQYRLAESESPDPFADWSDLPNLDGISPIHQRSPDLDAPVTDPPMPPSRNTTRRSGFVDLTESSPPSNNMPPSRKRKAEDGGQGRVRKTARASASRATSTPKRSASVDLDKVEVVDLADVENEAQYNELAAKQQAELIKKQQQDEATRPVRLADFNCIICMDNPTDLTVTHCGHLFCSECLHQALYAGDKRSCPVCRTAISTTLVGGQKKQPKNGVYALEMKLMTANRKGKRPVRS
ncbi:hypothetical protein G7Y89_g3780 [Cudoniella acicularis]|uniref:RING-type domain-containing protein n=1 Tax=Cudoniella acicularis TaxID=354080 RepID=A0A8H4W4W0_9HELO|nr:hypothetical protein G7Y89_g3780 [Cudoniella acicularis]